MIRRFSRGVVHTESMKIRPKLSGAPLAYTVSLIDGTADPLQSFSASLWADDRAVPVRLKELVFLRTSVVNECHT